MEDSPSIPNNILHAEVCFPHFASADRWDYFLQSSLGQIYRCIPWKSLVDCVEYRLPKKSETGRKGRLDTHGKIALMFLKAYLNVSDKELVERLNTDYSLQYFCHCYVPAHNPIRDQNLPSKIRVELGQYISYEDFQKKLAEAWKDDLDHHDISMQDATCYESMMRYPTSVKILYEAMEYLEKYMRKLCKTHKKRMPRNKYSEQKQKTLDYLKTKRKTYKKTRRRTKSLLFIVKKQIDQMDILLAQNSFSAGQFTKRYPVIKLIVQQQQSWYEGVKPDHLIVSIDKPYIRAIVRGKENKRVEFGAKVNMLQVDGINFIEHLSFEAFHEGNRLIKGIHLHRKLFGKCKIIAADAIYATNHNRKYCSGNYIETNFKRKGRPSKVEDQKRILRKELNRQRSTTLEGSFGVEKERYGLRKVPARTENTEMLMIYFAVHFRNTSVIAQRRARNEKITAPKAA